MPATPYPNSLSTVTTSTVITADYFNSIKNQIDGLLTDYGYNGMISKPVQAGDPIKLLDWQRLVTDFQRSHVHQNNEILSISGNSAQAVNTLVTAVNLSYQNSSTVSVGQLSSATIKDARTTSWASTITHASTLTWATAVDMRRFFLLGSNLQSMIGVVSGSDLTWQTLIAGANSRLQQNNYDWGDYLTSSSLYAKAVGGSGFIWSTDPSSFLAGSLNKGIALQAVRNSTSIDYYVKFSNTASTLVLPYHTMTYFYSVGDRAVSGFTGIAAPLPTAKTALSLETSAIPPAPVIPSTRKLVATMTSSTFTFTSGTFSYYVPVNVENQGNTPIQISGITYTSNSVTADPSYAGDFGGTAAHSLPPSVVHSFALRYTSNTVGTHANSFTIISDNDTGNVTVPTRQVVTSPAYYFTVSPPSITVTRTDRVYVSAVLTINEFNGDYFTGPGSYDSTPTKTGDQAIDFILDTSTALGPTIAFDPTGKSNGLYVCTVSITINSYTVTVPISLILNIPAAVNTTLGYWLSPIQKNNGIIGMSYDIINDQRYLTIGVGTGADGSPEITDGSVKTGSYGAVIDLDYDSDLGYTSGPVVYASDTDGGSGSFFTDYAVWTRSSLALSGRNEPRGIAVTKSYTFSTPSSTDYTWTVSADYLATVIIDDAEVYTGGGNPGSSESGQISLDAGTHTISWRLTGDSYGPTGVAIQIKRSSDNLNIWNTRQAVRTTTPYLNWNEVYRIPISTSVSGTQSSGDYLIKSWYGFDGLPCGFYFKDNHMFTIVNDGTGDLTITVNTDLSTENSTSNPSVLSAHELFYYYSSKSVRVENLSAAEGDGTQTRWFRGFDKNGGVKTSLQNYPGSPTGGGGVPIGGGGGGGGGGESLLPS